MTARAPRLLTLAALAAALAAACGYRTGLTAPEGHQRVGVEVFGNDSKERDLERVFHEELTRSLTRRVDVRLVKVDKADLVLRGEIVDFRRRGGIRSIENELLEAGVQITVRARLERQGPEGVEVLRETSYATDSGFNFDTPPFNQDGIFLDPRAPPSGHQNVRISNTPGEFPARQRVLRNLADRVVLELFAPTESP